MKTLDDIHRQLAAGEFEFSRHAFKRAIERNISDAEIQQAGAQARLIEDYPDDEALRSKLRGILRNSPKPLPSFAKATEGSPRLHPRSELRGIRRRRINMRPAACCSDSPSPVARCIFRLPMSILIC